MKAAENVLFGSRMVFLHKLVGHSQFLKLVSPEHFHEETAIVHEGFGDQDDDIA
jgi:hypothetical protein